ncbi:MAG: protocatechuate 4,5-dioxygenase subunit alpha [Opitutaceae bacterium]|nr:protocatechuate 4,5-dioxygenase subunit alpha [Opitutaceae bacterium]
MNEPLRNRTAKEELEDIPGTYVFNRERCRQGLHLNLLFSSLLKAENRTEFLTDETKYLAKFPLTEEQRRCVLERDWSGMLKVGGNIYHMSKLGGTDQRSFQYLAGAMSGMTQDQYRAMMVQGGRGIEGNRSRKENAGGKS